MNPTLESIFLVIGFVSARIDMPDNTVQLGTGWVKGAGCSVPLGKSKYATATPRDIWDNSRNWGVSTETGSPYYGNYQAIPELGNNEPHRYIRVDFFFGSPDPKKPGSPPYIVVNRVYTDYPKPGVSILVLLQEESRS